MTEKIVRQEGSEPREAKFLGPPHENNILNMHLPTVPSSKMETKGPHLLKRKDFITSLVIATVLCGIAFVLKNETGGELFSMVATPDTQRHFTQMDKHIKMMEQEIGTLRKR